MSRAVASMTRPMRRAGLGLGTRSQSPLAEAYVTGRLAGISPDVATAGEPLPPLPLILSHWRAIYMAGVCKERLLL